MGQSDIKTRSDVSPAVEKAYAVAMKRQKLSASVKSTCENEKHSQGNEATCFSCGKLRHLRKDCQNPSGNRKGLPPCLCPCCGEENLGGMNVNQSPRKMGLSSIKMQGRGRGTR